MGNFSTRIADSFRPLKQRKLLLQGLDAAGKTTLLYRLTRGEVVTTIPTIGFNVETACIRGSTSLSLVTAWDVGGRGATRPLMRYYYPEMDGLLWVVDSNDSDRFDQVLDEINRAFEEKELRGVPCLFFCNKQDLPNAVPPKEVARRLQLDKIKDRPIKIFGGSAMNGADLKEAFKWLEDAMDSKEMSPETPDVEVFSQPPPLDHDPLKNNLTLKRFGPIQQVSSCPFAKSAKLWGGPTPQEKTSLEDQAKFNVSPLWHFVDRVSEGAILDGFCVELDDPMARTMDPRDFGDCVRRFLLALSDLDPNKESAMRVAYIGARGWRFRFHGLDFFVTTFAPCYPATHSRYAFGSGRAFLLLQPEVSFLRHKLPEDTPDTNWEDPQTIRDKTRVAFKEAGRTYFIPTTTKYPPAEHIVKPLKDDGTLLRWWKERKEQALKAQ